MFDPISIGIGIGLWRLSNYIFDEFSKDKKIDPAKKTEIEELGEQPVYLIMAILAKFAKLDGIITKNEILVITTILNEMNITDDLRSEAKRRFSKYKTQKFLAKFVQL